MGNKGNQRTEIMNLANSKGGEPVPVDAYALEAARLRYNRLYGNRMSERDTAVQKQLLASSFGKRIHRRGWSSL
jgi:hypothetical protein